MTKQTYGLEEIRSECPIMYRGEIYAHDEILPIIRERRINHLSGMACKVVVGLTDGDRRLYARELVASLIRLFD